ncbi:MAG: hypothetical protein ACK4RK_14905 [Gemmataceae bacterium]
MGQPETTPLRKFVYVLFITVAAGAMMGRILSVQRVYEPDLHRIDPGQSAAIVLAPLGAGDGAQAAALLAASTQRWDQLGADEPARVWPRTRPAPTPMFSSNDRSRWATVRALVDEGTYAIGRRDPALAGKTNQYGDTGIIFEDGWQSVDKVLHPQTNEFYSSKPPLLATLMAGEYWLLQRLFGWTFTNHLWTVTRMGLITVNLLPLIVFWFVLSRLVERLGQSDWGRIYVMAAACFGTFLTTFAITFNNHIPAACCALFALYPALRIWSGESQGVWLFVLAGFFASLTACFELPALSFAVALLGLLAWRSPRRTLLAFVPAAALPAAAFFWTNHAAIGQWQPAYSEFGSDEQGWYNYPGSHWDHDPSQPKPGIDFIQEPKPIYALHMLVGHHGILSLSPIFLLTVIGMIGGGVAFLRDAASGSREPLGSGASPGAVWPLLASLSLLLSVVVVGFFIWKSNNYGGWTSGLRWLFWLIPLWLLTLTPVADWLAARRWGRCLGYVLLAVSVLSVSYPAWNPWRHPWLYNWMEWHGWIQYG